MLALGMIVPVVRKLVEDFSALDFRYIRRKGSRIYRPPTSTLSDRPRIKVNKTNHESSQIRGASDRNGLQPECCRNLKYLTDGANEVGGRPTLCIQRTDAIDGRSSANGAYRGGFAHISCPSRAARAIDSSRSFQPANGGSLPASARSLPRGSYARSPDADAIHLA